MTPEQTRIQTKLTNLQRENTHRMCSTELRQVKEHWGLFCTNKSCNKTNTWIKWVSNKSLT